MRLIKRHIANVPPYHPQVHDMCVYNYARAYLKNPTCFKQARYGSAECIIISRNSGQSISPDDHHRVIWS